jgi:hypothetical protein
MLPEEPACACEDLHRFGQHVPHQEPLLTVSATLPHHLCNTPGASLTSNSRLSFKQNLKAVTVQVVNSPLSKCFPPQMPLSLVFAYFFGFL